MDGTNWNGDTPAEKISLPNLQRVDQEGSSEEEISKTESKGFNTQRKRIRTQMDSLEQSLNKLDTKRGALDGRMDTVQTEIQKHLDAVKTNLNEVNTIKETIDETNEEAGEIYDKLNGLFDAVNQHADAVKQTHEQADALKTSIDKQAKTLFEKISNDFNGSRDKQKSETEKLRLELSREIRALLPDAATAGLASAYVDAKDRYTRKTPIVFFYTLFIVPLGILAWMIHDMFKQFDPHDFDAKLLVFRLGFSIPLVALSVFGARSIAFYRKLYEEYNHKQRVMQLYHGFMDKIKDGGTREQKQELMNIMLEAVKDKPYPNVADHLHNKSLAVPGLSVNKASSKVVDPPL